jgi:hypothetical protein
MSRIVIGCHSATSPSRPPRLKNTAMKAAITAPIEAIRKMSMRKIKELSTAIDNKNAEIQKLRDDAERCRDAAEAGSRSMEMLEQLRARKAELQAIAFVEKTTAQTEDIDAEILGLEQGAAETLARARAARLALFMIEGDPSAVQPAAEKPLVARTFTPPQASVYRVGLHQNLVTHPGLVNRQADVEPVEIVPEPEPEEPKSKLDAALKELAVLEGQRRELVVAWLADRREKAIDRYIKALLDLGPIIAETVAMDKARARFGDYNPTHGLWILSELRQVDLPIPWTRQIPSPNPQVTQRRSPITWLRDPAHGDIELELVLSELRAAGVVA